MKDYIQKYKHSWVALYALIYLPWFLYLEATVTTDYHLIYSPLDDLIPFCSWFIIPYLLWFGYVAAITVYLFLKSVPEFYKLMLFLCVGMTLFLIISTIYPNGQNLRPLSFDDNNIFTQLISQLYATDTPTNIFPSIHVYNSLGAYAGVYNNEKLRKNKIVNITSLILTILIVISTVTLKQHSILDMFGAFAIALPTYYLVYTKNIARI